MPVSTPQIVGVLAPALAAATLIGQNTPQLALGVATGLSIWVPQIVVVTVDTGTAGAGSGGPIPVIVPTPVLLGNLQAGFASSGLIGIYTPALAGGLATGMTQAFLQMLVKTVHAGVGTGAGVGKYIAPPATASMAAGLAAAGLVGDSIGKMALAIGIALDATFASLIVPVPIVGSASPTAASGSGVGKII